jgi:hypothetical protein
MTTPTTTEVTLRSDSGAAEDVNERELTAAEIDEIQREHLFASDDKIEPELFPRLTNLSAGLMYRAVIRPEEPAPPEYLTVPPLPGMSELETAGVISSWNMLWEAGQFRRRFFDEDNLPAPLAEIADRGDLNITFIPRTQSRYFEYAPLYHLLPRATLERFGLPLLHAGQWPFVASIVDHDRWLGPEFHERLTKAWAYAVWPHLMPASPPSAFTRNDPIKLLSHNLDFWLPAVNQVVQETLREFPIVDNGVQPGPVPLIDGSVLEGATLGGPRKGGDIWTGETDAAEALAWTVEEADRTGRLRGILDAVRSHRTEDDFSDRWSYAKADFERKLNGTRRKIKVHFVELDDTTPVQSPESEVVGDIVTSQFLALLNPTDRAVVIVMNSGVTKLTDVADQLGYANHSAVSKRLTRIRRQAQAFFDKLD